MPTDFLGGSVSSVGQPLSLHGGRQQGICQPEACQDCWLADIQGWKQQAAPCQRGPTSASILLPSSLQGAGAAGWEQAQKGLCSRTCSKWDNSAASRKKKKVLNCMYAVMQGPTLR